jgi:hypothetical protein
MVKKKKAVEQMGDYRPLTYYDHYLLERKERVEKNKDVNFYAIGITAIIVMWGFLAFYSLFALKTLLVFIAFMVLILPIKIAIEEWIEYG